MKVGLKTRTGSHYKKIMVLAVFIMIVTLVGCKATTKDTYKKGMEPLADKEYFLPKSLWTAII